MNPLDVFLVLISVLLSSLSQLILKKGMAGAGIQLALESGRVPDSILAIARSPYVIGGLACFALSAVVWLFVLSRVPVSLAYPFVALGIVLTVLGGVFIFREPLSLQMTGGVALIVTGVILVGLSRS